MGPSLLAIHCDPWKNPHILYSAHNITVTSKGANKNIIFKNLSQVTLECTPQVSSNDPPLQLVPWEV